MRRILPDRPLTRAEISRRHRAKITPEQLAAEKLASEAQQRKRYNGLPAEEKAKRSADSRFRTLERIDAGFCYRCRSVATHGIRCESHFFRMFARNRGLLPEESGAEVLRQLWAEQKGRCALSGVEMTTNTNRGMTSASVDHKVPKSRGGGNDKGNLQWVLYPLNVAKAAHSVDEFVDLCRKVAAHTDGRVVALRKV